MAEVKSDLSGAGADCGGDLQSSRFQPPVLEIGIRQSFSFIRESPVDLCRGQIVGDAVPGIFITWPGDRFGDLPLFSIPFGLDSLPFPGDRQLHDILGFSHKEVFGFRLFFLFFCDFFLVFDEEKDQQPCNDSQ